MSNITKTIIWYSRFVPTAAQVTELRRLFGRNVRIIEGMEPGNARDLSADFRASGADECVILAPLAMYEHYLKEGLRPLWPQTELDPRGEIQTPDGRCFRFVRFERLVRLNVTKEPPAAISKERPARVLWISRRRGPQPSAISTLRTMYDFDVKISRALVVESAEATLSEMEGVGACDLVFVGPLGIVADLLKLQVQPMIAEFPAGQQRLVRVTKIEQLFEPLKPE